MKVLESYTLLATKSKQNAEKAIGRFMEMASTEVSCEFGKDGRMLGRAFM